MFTETFPYVQDERLDGPTLCNTHLANYYLQNNRVFTCRPLQSINVNCKKKILFKREEE